MHWFGSKLQLIENEFIFWNGINLLWNRFSKILFFLAAHPGLGESRG